MPVGADDLHSRLATQALRRSLTEAEQALAAALEEIFTAGEHDFDVVVRRLNERKVAAPSGAGGPWTTALLESELKTVNESLDSAYATAAPIAAYR